MRRERYGNHPPPASNLKTKNESFAKNLRIFLLGNFASNRHREITESRRATTSHQSA
jgi:hypothetical protein